MMTYTEAGIQLMNEAMVQDTKIRIKKIQLVADPVRSASELTYDIESISVEKQTDCVVAKAVTDNNNFKDDYYFNGIYVYVENLSGKEILFCYQKTENCPVYIPKFDGRPVKSEISVFMKLSNTDNIEIQDGIYVLQTDFEKRMKETCNIKVISENETVKSDGKNTWYLRVTKKQPIQSGISKTLKVSPYMGIKVV